MPEPLPNSSTKPDRTAARRPFPWRLLWLDLLGSLLVAVGLLQWLAQGWSAVAGAQLLLGFALMAPLVHYYTVGRRAATQQGEQ